MLRSILQRVCHIEQSSHVLNVEGGESSRERGVCEGPGQCHLVVGGIEDIHSSRIEVRGVEVVAAGTVAESEAFVDRARSRPVGLDHGVGPRVPAHDCAILGGEDEPCIQARADGEVGGVVEDDARGGAKGGTAGG